MIGLFIIKNFFKRVGIMSAQRKGIVLAGGSGTRLYPSTMSISKQLIPIYDKPMVYYPISVLMLSGIREILIISTPEDIDLYKKLLMDGSQWGISIEYAVQPNPGGLAQAFLIGESFIGNNESSLILGDNIFYGHDLEPLLKSASSDLSNSTLFSYHVSDPHRFGVVEFDDNKNVISIEEKPEYPKSNFALTGLYFYDKNVIDYAKTLTPSARGELEITDLNKIYLKEGNLKVSNLGRGHTWLDTGTPKSLIEASYFIYTLEQRQGLKICCPEEIAYSNNWINEEEIEKLVSKMKSNDYAMYVKNLINH